MAEPFIGQIQAFGFNFPPRGWATCDGQLLSIAQNTALFSLLGTTYGGNGQTTFALPDLRGRASLHMGTGPGLTPRTIGESSGVETVTLQVGQIPSHNHLANCNNDGSGKKQINPTGNFPGVTEDNYGVWSAAQAAQMSPQMISLTGGGQPHNNMEPYLVINWCIALQGIFPPRN